MPGKKVEPALEASLPLRGSLAAPAEQLYVGGSAYISLFHNVSSPSSKYEKFTGLSRTFWAKFRPIY
jgi:hypothetical protein